VDGGNGEFVFMDWGNWELVDMDRGNGQMVTLGLETSIIGGPGQSESLAFGRDPVRFSLVGVSVDFLFSFFAVVVDFGHDELLLFLGLFAGGTVRSSVAVPKSNG
jgi:hypothetical protein